MTSLVEGYVTAHARLAEDFPGQSVDWVRQFRESSLRHLQAVGFPVTREEAWKYTDVRPILKHAFSPAATGDNGLSAEDIADLKVPRHGSHRLVFVNGHFSSQLSDVGSLPPGAWVGNLSSALEHDADVLESHLGRYVPKDLHGFAALNSAFLTDGAYISLGVGCALDRPIELVYVVSPDGESQVNMPRNLIIADGGSRCHIIERYLTLGARRYLTSSITELHCGSGCVIEHYKLQQEDIGAYHVGGLYVQQQRNSQFTAHNIALGGSIVRNDLHTLLVEQGAVCQLNGLYVCKGRQHMDNYTQIDHAKPDCTSREMYKGILDGRARAVFRGGIVVHTDAQHTDARQENRNLLLSHGAEVDTKPQLEIYADDVKCAHGATVGQLDPDQVFYLRTRGVDDKTARRFLTFAFANDILQRVRLTSVRSEIEEAVTSSLLDGHRLEDLL